VSIATLFFLWEETGKEYEFLKTLSFKRAQNNEKPHKSYTGLITRSLENRAGKVVCYVTTHTNLGLVVTSQAMLPSIFSDRMILSMQDSSLFSDLFLLTVFLTVFKISYSSPLLLFVLSK